MLNALRVRDELVERGLPPHVAEGFVRNFVDESGLDPGINEAAPTVPGSRGGIGLAQWTGPRRKALELFAAQSGRDVADPEAQFDFLMRELQGPERAAFGRIMETSNPNDAAAAIVQHFERPAKEHLDRRMAEYTGGSFDLGGDYGNAMRSQPQGDDIAAREDYLRNALRAMQPQPMAQPQGGQVRVDPFGAYAAGQAQRSAWNG